MSIFGWRNKNQNSSAHFYADFTVACVTCLDQLASSSPFWQPRPHGLPLVQNGRSEKPLAKAAEILQESWSILSRDTWWNGFFRGCCQRLVAWFVFCNWKPLFKWNKDISSCLRGEILTNFWSHFGSFPDPPFWRRRRPWGRGWLISQHDNERSQT